MRKKHYNLVKKEEKSEDGYSYTYELLVRRGVRTADFGLPLYSIKISMTDPSGNRSEREATDVFSSSDEAVRFFDRLVRNLATPIDLCYVVEDEVIS